MASSIHDVSGNVRVAVRVRPLVGRELAERDAVCITIPDADVPCVLIGGGEDGKTFAFDYVFSHAHSQAQVYDTCVQPLLDSFMKGYNSTILAYGQTGSGKTFTVGTGNETLSGDDACVGIIPRLCDQLFNRIAEARRSAPAAEFTVRITFLEIYGDEIRDLLNLGGGKVLSIRDGEHGISVSGATERACEGAADMLAALEEGSLCRTTGSTAMNMHSSRSHAIFTVVLDQRIPYRAEDGPVNDVPNDLRSATPVTVAVDAMEHRISKFHILDLAGSERAKKTQATGRRLQEGININLGLLALGNVISALSDDEKRRRGTHVPYRDSKLTRILQDSLGGNSQTCMIACVSPAEANFEESLNTLRYAARARNIKNKPVINRDANASQVAQLKAEIEALRAALHASGADRTGSVTAGSPSLIGAGVSVAALLEATGARDLSHVIDRLSEMRAAVDEIDGLRARCAMNEDDIARLETELKRVRASAEAATDARLEVEVKLALLEERGPPDTGDAVSEGDRVDAVTRLTRRLHELEDQLRVAQEAARHVFATPHQPTSPLQRTPSHRLMVRAHGPLSPVAATAAELEAALYGVDKRLLIGAEEDDAEEDATELRPEHGTPEDEAHEESYPQYPGSATFRRIIRRLDSNEPHDQHHDADHAPEGAAKDDADDVDTLHDVQREFESRQKAMSRHVEDLDGNITVKQRYVLALEEKAARLDNMKRIYDAKLREMERDMQAVIKEREQLMQELTQAEHMVEEERLKATSAIRVKLEEADRRVRAYQERVKNLENVSRMQARASAEIRRLQQDIAELRKARVAQVAMMRTEKQRFLDEVGDRKRQLLALQKEGAALKSELARVKADGERREAVLRRKVEEASAAGKRGVTATAAGRSGPVSVHSPATAQAQAASPLFVSPGLPVSPAERHPSKVRQLAVAAVARSVRNTRRTTRGGLGNRLSMLIGGPSDAHDGDAAATLRHQLEDAVARIAEKERRVEELERRLQARDADVRMLEQLVEQRDALKALAQPAPVPLAPAYAAAAAESAGGLDPTLLNDIDAFFTNGTDEHEPIRDASDKSRSHVAALRDLLITPRTATEGAAVDTGRALTEEESEALRELEDKIELAQTRLGYQDERILNLAQADEELAMEIAQAAPSLSPGAHEPVRSHSVESLQSLSHISTLTEAKTALKLLFGMVVDARREERVRSNAARELQVKLVEVQASLAASDASMKALRLEHERRLVDTKREQAAEMDTLLRLAASAIKGAVESHADADHIASTLQAPSSAGSSVPGAQDSHDELLHVASPAELMVMLRSTRERMTDMEERIATQNSAIKELQGERERLRNEINRLSMVALRKQEQQHRRSSREALRHAGTQPGSANSRPPVREKMSSPVTDPIHVQGAAVPARLDIVYGGPPHSAPSAVAAVAAANRKRTSSTTGSAPAAIVSTTDVQPCDDASPPIDDSLRTRLPSADDTGDAGNKARAWWSERGIVPVSVAVPPTAPPAGHGMAANVRIVVAPSSVPIKPLLRSSSRTNNGAAGPDVAAAAARDAVGKPSSTAGSESDGPAPVKAQMRPPSGKPRSSTAAVSGAVAAGVTLARAGVTFVTDLTNATSSDASGASKRDEGLSNRTTTSKSGSAERTASAARPSGFAEPMQVHTSIPDIMSPQANDA